MKKSEALKQLEKMANERKRILFPGFPAHAMPKTTYSDSSTNDLQSCIVDYLDLIGGWGVRVNTQGQFVAKLGRHIPSSTKKGTPDILGALPGGRFIAIECKQPGERLRAEQDDIREDITKAGAIHLIAYVGQFQAIYERIQTLINNQSITITK